jgi:hypothetical protein
MVRRNRVAFTIAATAFPKTPARRLISGFEPNSAPFKARQMRSFSGGNYFPCKGFRFLKTSIPAPLMGASLAAPDRWLPTCLKKKSDEPGI